MDDIKRVGRSSTLLILYGGKMSKREIIEQKTEELLNPIITENNFELVDVEYLKEGSQWYLRCYIDKEGGIDVLDCEKVSRALSDKLDEEDYISDAYILEVSSPGLTRPLKKDKDFARNIGKEVEIKTFQKIDGLKEFNGILLDYNNSTVTIEQVSDGSEMIIERSNISLIRLAFKI